MKIVFWGKGNRATPCFKALKEDDHDIPLIVTQPGDGGNGYTSIGEVAEQCGIKSIAPENPNDPEIQNILESYHPDLFVLAGYGKILQSNIIDIPELYCLNLHGGKLPEYRGSSPMNWCLINGESSFGLSVIDIDEGVDTGDILVERTFEISQDDTIRDLHATAKKEFPKMLQEAINGISEGTLTPTPQNDDRASYRPLRFPDDGLFWFDRVTARELHNRIRALTKPYPCAFTYFQGKKVEFVSSELKEIDHYGEPGRVYRKSDRGLLVSAKDKCLWITQAQFADTGESVFDQINRYEKFPTLRDLAVDVAIEKHS